MIYYKTDEEIELLRQSNLIVCGALALVASELKPGITGLHIDKIAETYIRDQKAEPGFLGYGGFPGTLCISINNQVVHGIPSSVHFKEGDVVSIDCGVKKNGFFGDSAYTFSLGETNDEIRRLLSATKQSLYLGIEKAIIGNRIGDIGFAIQDFIERENGFSIVRDLVGHGVGKNLHEPPEVPNYGRLGKGIVLKEGLVIAIEPMVNLGRKEVRQSQDGWTIITKDFSPSAHFEHSVAVRKNGVDILSNHIKIEEEIKKNINIEQLSINIPIFAPRN
jgi:methionyl aminopeptidase